eukprot:TRINITY_DN2794_c0_g2_i1.p1 TRINITY_DN2794_c0_g2~~TRINITY_DN2794_c0_g2_i1.p1  ORF type:complete len:224 (+),score=40.74 TRINITY_DN2794_c0_g2_i1:71-742(+)
MVASPPARAASGRASLVIQKSPTAAPSRSPVLMSSSGETVLARKRSFPVAWFLVIVCGVVAVVLGIHRMSIGNWDMGAGLLGAGLLLSLTGTLCAAQCCVRCRKTREQKTSKSVPRPLQPVFIGGPTPQSDRAVASPDRAVLSQSDRAVSAHRIARQSVTSLPPDQSPTPIPAANGEHPQRVAQHSAAEEDDSEGSATQCAPAELPQEERGPLYTPPVASIPA